MAHGGCAEGLACEQHTEQGGDTVDEEPTDIGWQGVSVLLQKAPGSVLYLGKGQQVTKGQQCSQAGCKNHFHSLLGADHMLN